jgi:hypothetical protein
MNDLGGTLLGFGEVALFVAGILALLVAGAVLAAHVHHARKGREEQHPHTPHV